MGCKVCENNNPNLPPAVLEIVNQEKPILFHKVMRSASLGDDKTTPPSELNYKNVLLVYEANNHAYLYSSDGAYTFISMGELDVDEIMRQLREHGVQIQELQETTQQLTTELTDLTDKVNTNTTNIADNAEKIAINSQEIAKNSASIAQNTTNISTNTADIKTNQDAILELQNDLGEETASRLSADETLQEAIDSNTTLITGVKDNLNQDVEKDTAFTSDTSTVSVEHTKVNLSTNTTSNISNALPVASETQAGVMNTATYQAVQTNAENVDAILNGAVAIENIPATPTQEDLTTSWKTATGRTELVNRASIYDIDNDKVWYYYENINEWKPITAATEGDITISTFTNETAGIIKGSENDGQLFAEADGTGSVVGWDGIKHDVDNILELLDTNPIPKLYNEYGTNTDGAVTQDFINSTLNGNDIIIGNGAKKSTYAPRGYAIAIGNNANPQLSGSSQTNFGIAIGASSDASSTYFSLPNYSIAIGHQSSATSSSAIGNNSNIAIGYSSKANYSGVAIGKEATSNYGNNGVAIGRQSNSRAGDNSVALGYGATTARTAEVSIGGGTSGPTTRYIANVTAGELDTDAVNVAQLNDGLATKVGEADFMTPEEFEAAWAAA